MPRTPWLSSVALLVLSSAGVAAPPATAPSTGPTLPPGEESSRPALVAEQANLPKLDRQPIDQLLSIGVEDQFLRVSARHATPRGQYAVQVSDWPGFVTVQHFGTAMFKLDHVALSDNDTTEARTALIVRPGYLQVARDFESLTTVRSVTLMQSRQFDAPNGDPVHLTVKESVKDDTRVVPPAIDVTAATFSDLVRDQPAVVHAYLLPILRDFGAANVLRASDPARAWQVLGPLLPRDASVSRQVDDLLRRLDSDNFADRAKAEESLEALGRNGAAELRRRDLTKLSPEAKSSVDNALRHAEPITTAKAQQLSRDVPFLLDTLTLDDRQLTEAAATRLAELTGKPIDLPADLPPAERDLRIDAYAATLGPATRPATQPAATPVP